jgi:hypothetical protein
MITRRGAKTGAVAWLLALAACSAGPGSSGSVTDDTEGSGDGATDTTDSGGPAGVLEFDPPGGLYQAPLSLSITSDREGTIRYTLDGSPPGETSQTWTGDLEIDATTRVRAALFDSDLPLPPRGSHSYLFTEPGLQFDSNLPVVVVETWGEEEIDNPDRPRLHWPVYVLAFEPGEDGRTDLGDVPAFHGRAGMHIRGNSTVDYPKKQYKLEIWDEQDQDRDVGLLGMPPESDWILHAPYSDKTLMRNFMAYTWSRKIGRYAVRTRFIEAFVDWDGVLTASDYVGVYVWMEKVKVGPHRVDIQKLRPVHDSEPELTGGYLIRRDWLDPELGPVWLETAVYQDVLLFVDPSPEEITTVQQEYLQTHLDSFEQALAGPAFTDPETGYPAYVDVLSFVDHHLIVELARNVDGYVLSTYIHKDRGGKINMGPVWDYNGSLGNADYFEAWDPEGWHYENPEFPADNPNGYHWYERIFEDPGFQAAYAARWRELRQGPWATDDLLQEIDEAAALLSEAQERNFQRWPILGEYVWPNDEGHAERTTYAEEIDYLKDWLQKRLAWIDSQLQ